MTIVQKLAKRAALLRLNNYECKVRLKDYGDNEFHTNGKVMTIEDNVHKVQTIYIKEFDEWWNVNQVTHVSVKNRFNPSVEIMMEVDWE